MARRDRDERRREEREGRRAMSFSNILHPVFKPSDTLQTESNYPQGQQSTARNYQEQAKQYQPHLHRQNQSQHKRNQAHQQEHIQVGEQAREPQQPENHNGKSQAHRAPELQEVHQHRHHPDRRNYSQTLDQHRLPSYPQNSYQYRQRHTYQQETSPAQQQQHLQNHHTFPQLHQIQHQQHPRQSLHQAQTSPPDPYPYPHPYGHPYHHPNPPAPHYPSIQPHTPHTHHMQNELPNISPDPKHSAARYHSPHPPILPSIISVPHALPNSLTDISPHRHRSGHGKYKERSKSISQKSAQTSNTQTSSVGPPKKRNCKKDGCTSKGALIWPSRTPATNSLHERGDTSDQQLDHGIQIASNVNGFLDQSGVHSRQRRNNGQRKRGQTACNEGSTPIARMAQNSRNHKAQHEQNATVSQMLPTRSNERNGVTENEAVRRSKSAHALTMLADAAFGTKTKRHVREEPARIVPSTDPLMAPASRSHQIATVVQISGDSSQTRRNAVVGPSIEQEKKEFSCMYCGVMVASKSAVNRHIRRIHLNIRPFKCEICDTSFGQRSDLKRHNMYFHEKTEGMQCSYCDYKTATKYNLKRHVDRMHRIESSSKV